MSSPPVSVFMTVRNEEAELAACVDRILQQHYDGEIELALAVGPSSDRTEEIAQHLAATRDRLVVVTNPTGLTPHGLNLAIAASQHDILVRCDGHALLPPDYVSRIVEVLLSTGAANVGGRMQPEGDSPLGRAVAHAMSSRFGLGGAAFHNGSSAGPQSTVYLGSFRRAAIEKVGGYDEYFLRAQDWQLNHRLREAGEVVWFDPTISVIYRPRSSWKALLRQQFRTGAWRRRVISRHGETASVRYLAPPILVTVCFLGLLAGLIAPLAGEAWALGLLVPAAYLLGVTVAGWWDGRRLDPAARRRLPLVMAAIHLAWGSGFLVGRG